MLTCVMASRERDTGRAHPSGAQKRKKKAQGEEKKNRDVESCRKITDMLIRPTVVATCNQPETSAELAVETQQPDQDTAASTTSDQEVTDISYTAPLKL